MPAATVIECAMFGQEGVSPDRIEFLDFLFLADYLRIHDRIDVALDPFPYGGGTTTCDGALDGRPGGDPGGERAVGRGGLSILSNIGLSELVAHDCEQYMQVAVELARIQRELRELRTALRDGMQKSPLMDAPRFARNVEAAYRAMWQRWCDKT